MDEIKIRGIRGEGRSLCLTCAERIYGDSLEMYIRSGEVQVLDDQDWTAYASKGLMCDECLNWIFPPEQAENPWWQVEPEQAEYVRLLAPFADFLETLQIDAMNLRIITR